MRLIGKLDPRSASPRAVAQEGLLPQHAYLDPAIHDVGQQRWPVTERICGELHGRSNAAGQSQHFKMRASCRHVPYTAMGKSFQDKFPTLLPTIYSSAPVAFGTSTLSAPASLITSISVWRKRAFLREVLFVKWLPLLRLSLLRRGGPLDAQGTRPASSAALRRVETKRVTEDRRNNRNTVAYCTTSLLRFIRRKRASASFISSSRVAMIGCRRRAAAAEADCLSATV